MVAVAIFLTEIISFAASASFKSKFEGVDHVPEYFTCA